MSYAQKTHSVKLSEITRKWYVVDAATAPVGRVSTEVAKLLIGKEKPTYSHHIDVGDYVIVINAAHAVFTGSKETDKIYYRHSGFPGGIKARTVAEQRQLDATELIRHSVRGMLPVNKLRDERLMRLKIYNGAEHGHEAQKPEIFKLKKGSK
jgi:large subunit ribosomal protein L13